MADRTSISQDNVACRFFLSGFCKDGPKCIFSHDPSRQVPDSVCRYNLQGKCVFGLNCRYDHILINEASTSKANSKSERMSADLSKYPLSSNSSNAINWINLNAPVFVPKHSRSYADDVKANTPISKKSERLEELCSFFAEGHCPFPLCSLIHGNVCELCHKAYLHPFNEEARKSHIQKCEKVIEKNITLSFGVHRSLNKTCGICLDVVLEKEPKSERRFGILENCNHVYCFSCIKKWRRSTNYECIALIDDILDPKNTRSCPECRIESDFIIPSDFFVDTMKEKQILVTKYATALDKEHCKYFKKGEGVCPFGSACFYLHAEQDGSTFPWIADNESSDTSD